MKISIIIGRKFLRDIHLRSRLLTGKKISNISIICSVFRKTMNVEVQYFEEFSGKSILYLLLILTGLHILLLKCEGFKFPRNPNAHLLELFCNTHFYGPLVVAMNMN